MAILIDGYNLLHAAGVMERVGGPGGLERSRDRLLSTLASSLTSEELARTAVVFDSSSRWHFDRPVIQSFGIAVHYAYGYEDADELLEELIRADSSPRQLVVVSSDHRLQRAARRRKAQAVDSDQWWEELLRRRRSPTSDNLPHPPRKPDALSEEEVDYWLDQFGEGKQDK